MGVRLLLMCGEGAEVAAGCWLMGVCVLLQLM